METIRTTYLGDLRTESTHVQSGSKLITDAPTDNMGKGEAFSPTDLLATALGCCIVTTMGIAANNHEISFSGVSIKVKKIMLKDPRRVGEIVVDIDMGNKQYSEKEKMILEKAGLTCPVAVSLHPDLKQVIHFNYK